MRKARGKIDQLDGYFHVENSLRSNIDSLSRRDMELSRSIMLEELHAAGLIPVLDQFHPRGFGLLLRKPSATESPYKTSGQPSACIKTLKQRISRQYNRASRHSGTIWRDRTKLFHIPDTAKDRSDVAAYILARPRIECEAMLPQISSTMSEARTGSATACAAIAQIFGRKRFSETQLKKLETRRDEIICQYRQPEKIRGRRGRKSEWRPDCERGNDAQSVVPPPGPTEYNRLKKQAKRRFFEMLDRYEAFCTRTGYDRLPRGYQGEDELRNWAAHRRGEYRRGRLPAWQLEALRHTKILDSPTDAGLPTAPSASWMRQYRALERFFREHGHSRVTRSNCTNQSLVNWVSAQRTSARKETLHPEKARLLDELNFPWGHPPPVELLRPADEEWRLPTHLL